MKIKLIADGSVAEVEDSWGERLIEQGKAVLPEAKQAKAEVAVTDKVPEGKTEAPKAEPKKAGKKR